MLLIRILLLCGLVALASCHAARPIIDSIEDFARLSNVDIFDLFSDVDHLNANHSSIEPRWNGDPPAPASDDVWDKVLCKGRKFVTQMSYSDYDVAQSLPTPAVTAASSWYFRRCRSSSVSSH
jgi:hypothetical protein